MKNIYSIIVLIIFYTPVFSQLGINTESPKTTLQINSSNKDVPLSTDGVLIPRVSQLINDVNIENGLLVFLTNDYDNLKTGFYWRKENTWIPFFSSNQIKADQTIALVNTNNRFVESVSITSNTNTSIRTLNFNPNTLKANDTENFSINSTGELVVAKTGKYLIQSTITIQANSDDAARDGIEIHLMKNGSLANPTIGSAFSYPMSSGVGATSTNSTGINGYIYLNAGDRLNLRFNRYYRDTGSNSVTISPLGNISTFTIRYLG